MTTQKTLFYLAAAAAFAAQSHAAIVYSNNFESASLGAPSAEFSGVGSVNATEGYSTHGFGEHYLYNDTSSSSILTLGSVPAHTSLTLTFDLAIIDSWDGNTGTGGTVPPDFFNVRINGVLVFSDTFDNFVLADGSFGGAPSFFDGTSVAVNGGWADSAYSISLTVPDTSAGLTVEWFASGSGFQAGVDESWAVDNIQVAANSATVPDGGSTFGLMGLSLVGLGVLRKASRKQKSA